MEPTGAKDPVARSVMLTAYSKAAGTLSSAAKEAALLARKAGSPTTLLTVRLPWSGTRLAEKKSRTSGTVEGLGVWLAVGVCVGVCEGLAVRVGEADKDGVVVGVAEDENDAVEVSDVVGVTDGDGVGDAENEGDAVGDGDGVGRMQMADEPEPNWLKPEPQTHERALPVPNG